MAFHDQILPVPFGLSPHIFESAEHAEIHAEIIDGFALHAAAVAVVRQFAFVEFRVKFQRLAIDDAVGVDVEDDGARHAADDGAADTRAMIEDDGFKRFGLSALRNRQIAGDGHVADAGDFHVVDVEAFVLFVFRIEFDAFQLLQRDCLEAFLLGGPEGVEIGGLLTAFDEFLRLDQRADAVRAFSFHFDGLSIFIQ